MGKECDARPCFRESLVILFIYSGAVVGSSGGSGIGLVDGVRERHQPYAGEISTEGRGEDGVKARRIDAPGSGPRRWSR